MKKAAGLLLIVLLAARGAGAQPASVVEASAYRAQLDGVLAALDSQPPHLDDAADALPRAWLLRAGEQQFTISGEWLRAELRRLSARPDAGRAAALRAQVRRLRSDLDAFLAPPRSADGERRRLQAILARREFNGVRGPNWLDRLKQRLLEYLANLLVRVWGSSSFPTIANVVVWALVVIALLVTASWIYLSLRRAGAAEAVPLPPAGAVSAKPWSAWLAEARQAAAGSEWRDAVRLAYWAGISWLESARTWPPDRARTPREYLRLLPAGSEHHPALSSLTRTFELAWYARQDADAETFSRAVQDLEKLGCRPS